MKPAHLETKQAFFYGWVIVAVTALVLVITAGARSAPSVFLLPIQAEMGWSKSTISLAIAFGLVLFGLGGPISGFLMARYGIKPVTLSSLILTALAMILSANLHSVTELNLFFGLLSGIGTGLVASVLSATIANRWFLERRGFVTGIFGASTSAGQLLFVPGLQFMVTNLGWRTSSLVIGAISLAVLIPVFFLMRDDPQDIGLKPLGAREDQVIPKTTPEIGVMARALRHQDFWLLAVTFFICGVTSNGLVGVHMIPHAVEHGMMPQVAANVYALMGLFNFVGTITSGYLTDRYDPRKLLAIYYTFRGLSLFILPFVHDVAGLSVFAVLFGLDYIATVPPTVALAADTFGRRNVGMVYGWIFASHQLGAALAGWLGGVARDSFGDYVLAFVVAGGIAIAGGLLSMGLRRGPQVAVASD
jgi:sugar phosphate permease